jgi:hypothetical protein
MGATVAQDPKWFRLVAASYGHRQPEKMQRRKRKERKKEKVFKLHITRTGPEYEGEIIAYASQK